MSSPIEYASPRSPHADQAEIVAGPAWRGILEYRTKFVLIGLAAFLFGLWFTYDGFVKWPRENEEARAQGLERLPHPGYDVPLQKFLGSVVPPAGLLLMAWGLYNSRGRYRLTGDTLYVPGHPPVPLDAIRQIDKQKWERKGIAYLDYELADGTTGRLKLDDFSHERKPTDAILDRIEKTLLPPEDDAAVASDAAPGAGTADLRSSG